MSKEQPKILLQEAFTESKGLEVDRIVYQGAEPDSPEVEGVIAKPSGAKEQSLPLIIYNTPGTKSNGTGHATTGSTIHGNVIPYAKGIGKNGSIVVSSSLREADEYGGSDVQDVLDIMEIGKQQPEWDGRNVIMVGFSRGAMMTYLAIKEGAELTGAIIAAGETDLYAGEAEREEVDGHKGIAIQNDAMIYGLKGQVGVDRQNALKSRSAIHWPEKMIDTPMLIIHGSEDKAVLPHHSIDMDEALTKAGGTNHTTKIHPDCGHGILMAQNAEKEYFVEKEVIGWCNESINRVNTQARIQNLDALDLATTAPISPEVRSKAANLGAEVSTNPPLELDKESMEELKEIKSNRKESSWVDRTALDNPRVGFNKTPGGSREI